MHATRRTVILLLLICISNTYHPSSFVTQAQMPFAPVRLCDNIDLSAFCLVDNHFSKMIVNEWSEEGNETKKYYLQWERFITDGVFSEQPWKESEDDKELFIHPDAITPKPPAGGPPAVKTTPDPYLLKDILMPKVEMKQRNISVFSALDMCEMNSILYKSATPNGPFTQFKENPFEVKITEVHVSGKRLHNHLHLQITGTEKFKYAILVVNDQDGWAVGDFNTEIPCHNPDSGCNCDPPGCHQGDVKDTIPCMFTSERVVTHPGQFMYFNDVGVSGIHVTWRFAQSADPNLFTKELHFRTLLINDIKDYTLQRDCKFKYQYSNYKEATACKNDTDTCVFSTHVGKVGWNAKYTIYHPTYKTIGAWDYFRKGYVKQKEVSCHHDVSTDFFVPEPYPTYGIQASDLAPPVDCKLKRQLQIPTKGGPDRITGGLPTLYNWLTWTRIGRIYFGVPDLTELPNFFRPQSNSRMPDEAGRKSEVATIDNLLKLPTEVSLIEDERCYCPRLGTAPPLQTRTIPKKIQLEARLDHAINMALAWFILVPLAVFVSRYYKETYSKVFFLQEYWWFTIHFLSLILACVFMLGGIYGIEVKRTEKFFVNDSALLAHIIVGGVSVSLFVIHLLLGVFRLRNVAARKVQIFLHWFFGVLEWVLALGAMLTVAWVPAGCSSCNFLIVAAVFVAGQILFFGIMEFHIHRVDKKLNLKPKRRYLPPPVMRVFHMNAPGSKFRIYMLIAYVAFCTLCYAGAHVSIIITPYYGSCFDADPEDTFSRIKVEESEVLVQDEQEFDTATRIP